MTSSRTLGISVVWSIAGLFVVVPVAIVAADRFLWWGGIAAFLEPVIDLVAPNTWTFSVFRRQDRRKRAVGESNSLETLGNQADKSITGSMGATSCEHSRWCRSSRRENRATDRVGRARFWRHRVRHDDVHRIQFA